MNDLISRQAAIDALRAMQTYKLFAGDDMLLIDQAEAQTELMMLPSAQPETHEKRTETCDLISRQMLLEYIHGEPVGRLLCDKYNLDGLIEQLPSAEPERKKGKWIRHDEVRNVYGGTYVECSECGEKYVVQYIEDEKYCRNCGADMRGEQDEL